MRVVTNQGSNIHPAMAAEYDLVLAAQDIDVDGIRYDPADGIEFDQLDHWIKTAKQHPIVLGSSTSQLVRLMIEVAKVDREILFITSSRKIVGTYDAAVNAAQTLREDRRYADLDIRILDSGLTDVGAALPTLLAAKLNRAGASLDQVEAQVLEFCRSGRMSVYVDNLEGLVKGGRASFLRSWMANILRVRPILGFDDGELHAVGRVATKDDPVRALAEQLAGEIRCDRVWVGVSHGNDPDRGKKLVAALGEVFELEYVYALPVSPSIYLHISAGSVGAAVFPSPTGVVTPIDLPRG